METALSVGTGRHLLIEGRAKRGLEEGDEVTFRAPCAQAAIEKQVHDVSVGAVCG